MRACRCSIFGRFGVVLGLLCLLAGMAAPAAGQGSSSSAAERPVVSLEAVKAAYLVNFIRFTTWPDERDGPRSGPFVVAVANNRLLEDALLRLAEGQLVRGRPVRVVRVRSPRDLEGSHLVWIEGAPVAGSEYPESLSDVLDPLRGRPVLTVSDVDGFLGRGGMIKLYREGENVRFVIDAQKTREAGLVLSSRLLALSRRASEDGGRR